MPRAAWSIDVQSCGQGSASTSSSSRKEACQCQLELSGWQVPMSRRWLGATLDAREISGQITLAIKLRVASDQRVGLIPPAWRHAHQRGR
jgi:hypothetical protein